ncbi:hypothetical protein AGMMS50268_21720 [Spirochaetia bacterium]|nr:hypothetical protein AGMMS50268_21720 [Spirochaetia bacterium]
MSDSEKVEKPEKRKFSKIESVGLVLVAGSMVLLLIKPGIIGDLFNAMFNRAFPIVVSLYLASSVCPAILISVTMGRLLERLGFTDALMRIFIPLMKYIRVNASVAVPAIYNILGDINAAGKIGAPILKKAGATKDEQKIAIATMISGPSSFSILVFGIICMTAVNAKIFLVFVLGLFVPVFVVPLLLRLTIWRDTKAVSSLADIPVFTPNKPLLTTIFGGAREGAEVLFLLIIPACAVVYAGIGALEYFHIWQYIQAGIETLLGWLNIEPKTGTTAILAGGTLAMAQLREIASNTPAPQVIACFILAASGFPLQVIFGQIPAIWTGPTDLSEKECILAAVVGGVIRIITAGIFGRLFIFLW